MRSILRAASFAVLTLFAGAIALEATPSLALENAPSPALAVISSPINPGNANDSVPIAAVQPEIDDSVPESLSSFTSLSAMVDALARDVPVSREEECVAIATYFEARSETLEGQLAVADVVINRAESGRFPTSLCEVVLQPGQFSFVKGRRMPLVDRKSRDWREAVAIAQIALGNHWQTSVEGALFFHARYVSPRWKRRAVARIGNHIFYR